MDILGDDMDITTGNFPKLTELLVGLAMNCRKADNDTDTLGC